MSDVVLLLAQYAVAPAEHADAADVRPEDAPAVAEADSTPAFGAFGFDSTAELARD